VDSLQAWSGHGDQNELLAWMEPMTTQLKKIFLVHGEPEGAAALQKAIQTTFKIDTVVPAWGESVELE